MKYVFGSWFDPVTKAHEAIIKNVYKRLRKDDTFVILVADTDEKNSKTPYEARANMVSAVLNAKKITNCTIQRQTGRMYDFLQANYYNEDITIVIGQDEYVQLMFGKWKNSNKLLFSYNFLVFYRENSEEDTTYFVDKNNMFVRLDNIDNISSSAVRKIFRRNPECHYKDVKQHISKVVYELVKDLQLYNQNPRNYAEIEKQFIDDYKKRGWGKFANTVDILAVSGDEVLLIRRKKPPYQGYFALPGGFFDAVDMIDKETGETVKADEDLEHAAQRELREETSLNIPVEKFEQIKTYSHMFDPRLRIVDTAFAVRIHHKDKKKAIAGDDAADAAWFNIHDLPKMAFHHEQIIHDYMNKLA